MSEPVPIFGMGAPRLAPCPPDAEFAECDDCRRDIMFARGAFPRGLDRYCGDCAATHVIGAPENAIIILPSGVRAVAASHILPRFH
jgi:hypothetical protein